VLNNRAMRTSTPRVRQQAMLRLSAKRFPSS
jgi:hypothetical protein